MLYPYAYRLYMDAEWAGAVRTVCGWSNDPWSAPGADLVDPDILEPVREVSQF